MKKLEMVAVGCVMVAGCLCALMSDIAGAIFSGTTFIGLIMWFK